METQDQLTLPKNVRQIGQNSSNQHIYIEDYVITYLRQLLESEKSAKVSVLYGYKQMMQDELYWFVTGAVSGDVDFFMDKSLLDEDSWHKAGRLADRFFPDYQILGWAIARGSSLDVYDQMIHTQKTYFRSDQKVFFEYLFDEKQENVYLYEKGKMILQTGYSIYYDRNECMQNYMVSLRSADRYPEEMESDRVAKQFREVCTEKKDERHRKRTSLVLAAASFALLAAIFAIGITMLGNYEKMESMERALTQISGKMNQEAETAAVAPVVEEKWPEAMQEATEDRESEVTSEMESAEATSVVVSADEEQKDNLHQIQSEEQGLEKAEASALIEQQETETPAVEEKQPGAVVPVVEEKQPEAEMSAVEEKQPEVEMPAAEEKQPEAEMLVVEENQSENQQQAEGQNVEETVPSVSPQIVYVVKKGDTLDKICMKYYGTRSKIQEICELNSIADRDTILYGQKLILPQ